MLLSGALFALFMMGFWLYCLTDAILTPAGECRGMPKPAWIAVITLTFIGGAVAWLIVREPLRSPASSLAPGAAPRRSRRPLLSKRAVDGRGRCGSTSSGRASQALGPHGARRGPDDDPEFLRALDRAIRGNSQAGGEV